MKPGQARLGAQLWLEQDADVDRVRFLVSQASAAGLDLLRVFLMWPWMEPSPGEWKYDPFDAAFDAAEEFGLRIKATLTANSGPWHLGTPSVLHSTTLTLDPAQRPAMRRYVENCVRRYQHSPALAQWIIWNEPLNVVVPPLLGAALRTTEHRAVWDALLSKRYDDIDALNHRWRTGYRAFSDVPFPEDLPHPAHRGSVWESYAPWLDEWRLRAGCLREELAWVAELVRGIDADTPLCVNPPDTFTNHAVVGYDLADLATVPDILGASFHAPWQLTFAPRDAHVALVVAGISLLAGASRGRPVELTEFQTGNTYYAGRIPLQMRSSDISSFYLASLMSGASSATGWALNTRHDDFEAGDWGLLDDMDQLSGRSDGVRRVRDVLVQLDEQLGAWQPLPPRAAVLVSEASQAVQMVTGFAMVPMPGRHADDAIHGSALLAVELLRLGVSTSMCPTATLPEWPGVDPELIVVSHMTAWDEDFADELLRRVSAGAVLLVDGTSGHKTVDAAVHRPWPGGLAQPLGMRARGLLTDPAGFPITNSGVPTGGFPLVLGEFDLDMSTWAVLEQFRLPRHGSAPCVWSRRYARGRVLLVSGALGPSVAHGDSSRSLARALLSEALPRLSTTRPLSPSTIAVPVRGEQLDAVGIFAPASPDRAGQPLRLAVPPGSYRDVWSGDDVRVDGTGEVSLEAADGIAVLVGNGLAAVPEEASA